jgi:pimeloyl-ACP methyl ester carboxylesterase
VKTTERGAGAPVVVLHGAGGPPPAAPALDLLATEFRLIEVTLTGWDDEPADHITSMADLASEVASIIDEPVHVLGTSLGGAVALHLALDHPEKLQSIVLESPAAFRVGATPPNQLSPEQMVKAFRRHPEREPHMQPPDPAKMAKTWPVVERVLVSTPPYDEALVERMKSCAVRTLVLFGEFDGTIPVDNGRTYRRFLTNCSFQIVHDAAHDIQADRPEAFADVVSDFLRRGMAFLVPDKETLINP